MTRLLLVISACTGFVSGCTFSSHQTRPSSLGTPRGTAALLAVLNEPGEIEVETIAAAHWEVDRSGVLNLDHPRAKEAGLKEGDEPIQIYFHVLKHPARGTFIVDTGVEQALRDSPDRAAIRGLVASVAKTDRMKVLVPLAEWIARQPAPLRGVLLTHLHIDHISGMPDVPKGTPIYAGPGETTPRAFQNLFSRGTIDRQLEGHGPIEEWAYAADPEGRFDGVLDVFGDGSLWALHVPGHTPGSTAYLARTPRGPVLFVGDACHTAWGWREGVEPGGFSFDRPRSAVSLERLRTLAREHPAIDVRLGHQPLEPAR